MDGDGYGPLEPVTDSLRECYLEQLALYGEVEISTQGDEDSNIGNAWYVYRLPGIVSGNRYRRLPDGDDRWMLAQGVDNKVCHCAVCECEIGIRGRVRLRVLGMYGIIFH